MALTYFNLKTNCMTLFHTGDLLYETASSFQAVITFCQIQLVQSKKKNLITQVS